MLMCNLAKHLDSIHARHVQIERNHVRTQFSDFFQAHLAVHCRAYYFNGGVAMQHLRNQLPHQRRIVDHKNANLPVHAIAPTG